MALEMSLDALGKKAFAAALTPAGQRGASPLGFHAGAKTMLLFPGALGSLKSAFHRAANRMGD